LRDNKCRNDVCIDYCEIMLVCGLPTDLVEVADARDVVLAVLAED
jgi:hypothetical protein